jgi:glycosyltransferase involved in cell wall biosynthesis
VVTDAGDSGRLVANTGRVVPVQDPAALAEGCFDVLSLSVEDRTALGRQARLRVESNFSLARSAAAYDKLYRTLLD